MSKAGMKEFFGTWYGKAILSIATLLLGSGMLFISSIPFRDRSEAFTRIRTLEAQIETVKADTNARLVRIETNLEWLVRRMGGDPQ